MSVRSDLTLGEYAQTWLDARRDLKPTALDNLCTSLVNAVTRVGKRRVQEVSAEDVAWPYDELAEHGKRPGKCRTAGVTCAEHGCAPERHDGLAPKSRGQVHAALRAILAPAVEDGFVPSRTGSSRRTRRSRSGLGRRAHAAARPRRR